MTETASADGVGALLRGPSDVLCLAFANTRYWRGTDAPTEQLGAPADLLRWRETEGGLDQTALRRTRERWEADPAQGSAVLSAALALREALFRLFTAGGAAGTADLAVLNAALSHAPPRTRLRPQADGYGWELPADLIDAQLLLAPVLWSAGDLLAGARLGRVRQCANPRCRWLFVDDSKSGNRRWCAMAMCGNRAKAQRHYARRRQAR
jgi:predicted RNA-binding Zn ribbon-like protein